MFSIVEKRYANSLRFVGSFMIFINQSFSKLFLSSSVFKLVILLTGFDSQLPMAKGIELKWNSCGANQVIANCRKSQDR